MVAYANCSSSCCWHVDVLAAALVANIQDSRTIISATLLPVEIKIPMIPILFGDAMAIGWIKAKMKEEKKKKQDWNECQEIDLHGWYAIVHYLIVWLCEMLRLCCCVDAICSVEEWLTLYVCTEWRINSVLLCVEWEQFPNISIYAITMECKRIGGQKRRRKKYRKWENDANELTIIFPLK